MFSQRRDWLSCTPDDVPLPSGETVVVGLRALFVERVTGFVNGAEELFGQKVLVCACGNPNVAVRKPRHKRMRRRIQPPAVEVVANRRDHALGEP